MHAFSLHPERAVHRACLLRDLLEDFLGGLNPSLGLAHRLSQTGGGLSSRGQQHDLRCGPSFPQLPFDDERDDGGHGGRLAGTRSTAEKRDAVLERVLGCTTLRGARLFRKQPLE